MLRLWVYGFLNNRFGQVGDVGNMCPATLFKLLGIINIWKTLYGIVRVLAHGTAFVVWHGIKYILAGIYLVYYIPKEAGRLSMEYNVSAYTSERIPGYIDNWKELCHG
jgi:hypothetical protein